jgi:hypothetical protein
MLSPLVADNIPTFKRGGMFGGGARDALMAAAAGFLARRSPQVASSLLETLQRKQMLAQQEAQYQRRRDDQFADWRKQYDYEVGHPKQAQPHFFESNSGDQYAVGQDGKPVEVFHDPFRYKLVPNGMGGVVPVDISKLVQQPLTDEDIDRLGGPAASPPATFPRY